MIELNNSGNLYNLSLGRFISQAELDFSINQLSSSLSSLGISGGSIVIISYAPSSDFFVSLFAVWSVGACALCLPNTLTFDEFDRYLSMVDACYILSDNMSYIDWFGSCVLPNNIGCGIEDSALMLFTSGSTGNPKCVVHTRKTISARISSNHRLIDEDVTTKTLCILPFHFGHGLIGNSLTPLLRGDTLYFYEKVTPIELADLGTCIDAHNITFFSSVPAQWTNILTSKKPSKKITVFVGSSPLSLELWNRISDWVGSDETVFNMYGLTETANWIAGCNLRNWNGIGSVGYGNPGVIFGLLRDGVIVSTGEGEILAKSPANFVGYYKNTKASQDAIYGQYFKTGDIGIINSTGYLRLTGRIKNQINVAGLKVQPEEVEELIADSNLITDCCSFGLPDPLLGEIHALAISLKEDTSYNRSLLKEYISSKLSGYKVPSRIFWLESIPRSERGKLIRNDVMNICLEIYDSVSLTDLMKISVSSCIARILDIPESEVTLSGSIENMDAWDSLATLQIVTTIENIINRKLKPREILSATSVIGVESLIRVDKSVTFLNSDLIADFKIAKECYKELFGSYSTVYWIGSIMHFKKLGISDCLSFFRALLDEIDCSSQDLFIPSFTFSYYSDLWYDPEESSPTESLLSRILLLSTVTKRSLHPIYSVLAYGSLKPKDSLINSKTSWGEGSLLKNVLHNPNACIVISDPILPDNFLYGTTLPHVLEEECKVPYRFLKSFPGSMRHNGTITAIEPEVFVRNASCCVASNWEPLSGALTKHKQLVMETSVQLPMKDLLKNGLEMIADNEYIFCQKPD